MPRKIILVPTEIHLVPNKFNLDPNKFDLMPRKPTQCYEKKKKLIGEKV